MKKILEKHNLLNELNEKAKEKKEIPPVVTSKKEENPSIPETESPIHQKSIFYNDLAIKKTRNNRMNLLFERYDPNTTRELVIDSIILIFIDKTDITPDDFNICLENILCYSQIEVLSMRCVRLEDDHIRYLSKNLPKYCPHIKQLNFSSIKISFYR